MTNPDDLELSGDTPEELAAELAASDAVDSPKSVLKRELDKAVRANIDLNEAAKAIAARYINDGSENTVFDLYGVGTVRGFFLIANGYDSIEALANATVEDISSVDRISEDLARVFVEHAREKTGLKQSTSEALAETTGAPVETFERALSALGASGVAPSDAQPVLEEIYSAQQPRLVDIKRVDPRNAYFLHEAGYTNRDAIATASPEELEDVRYMGSSNVKTAIESAKRSVTDEGNSRTGDRPQQTRGHKIFSGDSLWPKRVACIGAIDTVEAVPKLTQSLANKNLDAILYAGRNLPRAIEPDYDFIRAFEEIYNPLASLSELAPVGFVLGRYSHDNDGAETIDSRRGYSSTSAWQETPQFTTESELTYIGVDTVASVGGIRVAQNPHLTDEETVLLTYTNSDSSSGTGPLCQITGAGIFGGQGDNWLNTIFAVTRSTTGDRGPIYGGAHIVEITEDGIVDDEFVPIGPVREEECPLHRDVGTQYVLEGFECPYCANRDVVAETSGTAALPHQFPSETTWQHDLVASWQVETDPYEHEAYYERFDVTPPRAVDEEHVTGQTLAEQQLDMEAIELSLLTGEWVSFHDLTRIDEIWSQLRELVADGTLYDARAETQLAVELNNGTKYPTAVSVPNYLDKADIERVYTILDGFDAAEFFKPLLYTYRGITGATKDQYNLEYVTRYRDIASTK